MGLLNSDTQIVDAVLTKVGKRRLAEGTGLNITDFALSDDYTSYFLYNTAHVSGSAKYGEAIENLPLPEATTSGAALRYELTTRDRNTVYNAFIEIPGQDGINGVSRILDQGSKAAISLTPNQVNATETEFTFSFTDISGLRITGASGKVLSPTTQPHVPRALNTPIPAEYKGTMIHIEALPAAKSFETLVTIGGNNSGAVKMDHRILIDANIASENQKKKINT